MRPRFKGNIFKKLLNVLSFELAMKESYSEIIATKTHMKYVLGTFYRSIINLKEKIVR